MNRYFLLSISRVLKMKPKTNILLGFVCFLFLVLGGLLEPVAAQVFRINDEVVAQNTLNGLKVYKEGPKRGSPEIIADGTRGIILELRKVNEKNWCKVEWQGGVEGWSQLEDDGCNAIGPSALADRRDKIVTVLFLDISHQNTHHDYNGYRCSLTWTKKDKEGKDKLVYTGGHGGWDAQTADKSTRHLFYSLTAGEIIADGTGDYNNTIAVWDPLSNLTTLYLHASDVLVSKEETVEVGQRDKPLGKQGNTGNADSPHVHIEVRVGKNAIPSNGAGDNLNPTINPVPYLYRWVAGHLRERFLPADVNHDGNVNFYDWVKVLISALQNEHQYKYDPQYDVNSDGIVNRRDLTEVSENFGASAPGAPAISTTPSFDEITVREGNISIGDVVVSPETVQQLLDIARKEDNGAIAFKRGIAKLESLLATMIPEKTMLLANYPNPFNPETWIPYYLAMDTEVTVTIYNAAGAVVRRLEVGYQKAGYYTSRKRAVYWDGRTETGERAASGVYFYTFTTSKFTATRRMVILK